MLRLTLLLSLGMFAALMTLGSDRGQLRPGLALAASEGRLDAVWAEARADADPAAAPALPMPVSPADPALAAADPVAETAAPAVAAPELASIAAPVETMPLPEVVQAVEEPVFTLASLGNELVPGEDGTAIETADSEAVDLASPAVQADGSLAAGDALPQDPMPELAAGGEGTIWYVNASSVNVRSAPTTDSEVLGKLGAGEAALMVAAVDGQWARIVIQGDGLEGYVALQYLSPTSP